MNDGELIAWQVLVNAPTEVLYTCLRQETAEYLRDWCEAEVYDRAVNYRKRGLYQSHEAFDLIVDGYKFSISECEVLV